jgi:hypothetical protein
VRRSGCYSLPEANRSDAQMTYYRLRDIRAGRTATFYPSREKRKKLWNWCRKHSDDGKVYVRVLWSLPDYNVKEDKKTSRMGQAIPLIRTFPRWNYEKDRYEIHYSEIYWSYVY